MVRLLAFCLAAVAVAAASRRRTRGLKAPMSLKSENYFAVLENMVGVQEKELTFLHSKTAAALKHDTTTGHTAAQHARSVWYSAPVRGRCFLFRGDWHTARLPSV